MSKNDCPECAAFIAEMKAAITEQFGKRSDRPMSREQIQQAVARDLALPEEAAARLRESFGLTKAGQVYARFIRASHITGRADSVTPEVPQEEEEVRRSQDHGEGRRS